MTDSFIPPAVIDVIGRDTDLLSTIARDKSALADLAKTETDPKIGADSGGFQRTLTEVKTELLDFAKSLTKAKLGADAAPFWTAIASIRSAVDAMSPLDIKVDANTSTLLAQIESLRGYAASAQTGSLLAGAAGAAAAGGGDKGGGGGGGLGAALGFGGLFGLAGFGTIGSLLGFGPESLLTTGLGIAGSAAGAAVGGGALALGSAGVAGVGMGTDLAGIGQASNDAKAYTSALDNLNQAIAVYGPLSTQAQTAQAQFNYTVSQFPAVAQPAIAALGQTGQQFHTLFNQATGEAEAKGAAILQQLVQVGEKFLPTIGQFASQNMTIIQSSLRPLLTWIQGPGLSIFRQLEQTFQNQLPTAMNAFNQGVELLIRTLGFLAPYTGRLVADLSKWLTALNGADFGKFTGGINTAIGIFRDWEGLVKAIGTAIYELFSHDAGTGTSLVVSLTNMVNKFNAWAQTVAGGDQLHALLESHKQELLAIVGVIGQVISTWGQLELTVRPILMDIVTGLASVFNFLSKIPGVGQIMGAVIAFELLGSHVGLLNGLLGKFNGVLAGALKSALVALGATLTGLGGPFASVGGWLTKMGTVAPTEAERMAASWQAGIDAMVASNTELIASLGGVDTALATTGGAAGTESAVLSGSRARGAVTLGGGEAASVGTAAEGAGATGAAGISAMLGPIALVAAGFAGLAYGANALGHAMGVGLNQGAKNMQDLATKMQALPTGSLDQANASLETLTQKLMHAAPPGTTLASILQKAGDIASNAGSVGFTGFSSAITGMVDKYHSLTGAVALGNSNIAELSNITGLAAPMVNDLANKLGINLTQALNPAAVQTMTNYIAQQGGVAVVTGQEWQASSQTIQAAMQLMAAAAASAMPNISTSVRNMIASVQPQLVTLVSGMQKAGDGSGAAFVSAFIAHLSPAQLASKQMHDGMLSPLYPLVTELQSISDTAAANMVMKFIGHQGDAKSGAQGMHDAIANPFSVLQSQLSGDGDAAGAGLIADFIKHHPEASTQAGLMHDAITGKLAPLIPDLQSIGDNAAAQFVAQIINQNGNASAAGAGLGAAVSQGLASGITSSDGVVVNAVDGIVQTVIKAGQTGLRAASPSKEAAEKLGVPVAEGIAMGMLSGVGSLRSASSALVAAAIGARVPAMSGAGAGGSSTVTFANTYNINVPGTAGNPHQVGTEVKNAIDASNQELIRRLAAGSISSAGG